MILPRQLSDRIEALSTNKLRLQKCPITDIPLS